MMMDYKVVSLYNKMNRFTIDIYQRTKSEYKVRTQINYNSYHDDYIFGLYDLTKTVFCYIINNYEMTINNLGFDFAYAVHSGDFTQYEPPLKKTIEPEKQAEEPPPIEDPSILTRIENVIIEHNIIEPNE